MPSAEDGAGNRGEAGLLAERARGEGDVLRHVAHPARDPDRARLLHLVQRISEFALGLTACVPFRHTRLR